MLPKTKLNKKLNRNIINLHYLEVGVVTNDIWRGYKIKIIFP